MVKNNKVKNGDNFKEINIVKNRFIRGLLIIAGIICVALGTLGIFLPLLPTTPFLLLAAACFARSSKRFYNWLINNKWFGEYIKNYSEGKGIPKKAKVSSIALLWITILISAYFFVDILFIRVILIIIAIGVSIIILKIKTYK